ncbi:MAG: AraC family transcriptional regulator [Prevotella sp.]|nr:AraC family transcriptional regulator [Prevotella sp.]
MQQEEITLQTLTDSEDINIGYSDNDIVVVDSIQQFTEINAAHVSMSAIAICTCGRVQGYMNGHPIELRQNQVGVIPTNAMVTDLMISPDFNLKAMFFTNQIIQSFLREKMSVWNEMMYVQRMHIITLNEDEMRFYTHFYDMLRLCFEYGKDNPYNNDVIKSLLRCAVLALCGAMKQMLPEDTSIAETKSVDNHFQRFLDLLSQSKVKHRKVEAYASELCISPKYLSVICKKHSGKTANEWIAEHVQEDIRYYLCHTDLSVKQVSYRLGFPNPSFFGKYVKEHFGLTPTQLRKSK